jgi:hypothetical protein
MIFPKERMGTFLNEEVMPINNSGIAAPKEIAKKATINSFQPKILAKLIKDDTTTLPTIPKAKIQKIK